MKAKNVWNDPEDFGIEGPQVIRVNKRQLLKMCTTPEGKEMVKQAFKEREEHQKAIMQEERDTGWAQPNKTNTEKLSRKEKKEMNDALKDITYTSKDWQAAFALFMFIGWPLIWILIAHFAFHF